MLFSPCRFRLKKCINCTKTKFAGQKLFKTETAFRPKIYLRSKYSNIATNCSFFESQKKHSIIHTWLTIMLGTLIFSARHCKFFFIKRSTSKNFFSSARGSAKNAWANRILRDIRIRMQTLSHFQCYPRGEKESSSSTFESQSFFFHTTIRNWRYLSDTTDRHNTVDRDPEESNNLACLFVCLI